MEVHYCKAQHYNAVYLPCISWVGMRMAGMSILPPSLPLSLMQQQQESRQKAGLDNGLNP